MYRIHFDVKAGVWRIQIRCYGLFWSSVCDAGKVRGWANVRACEEFITNTGLSDIYRNWQDRPAAAIWAGGVPIEGGYQPIPQVVRRRTA
jgi:hypothetical protein